MSTVSHICPVSGQQRVDHAYHTGSWFTMAVHLACYQYQINKCKYCDCGLWTSMVLISPCRNRQYYYLPTAFVAVWSNWSVVFVCLLEWSDDNATYIISHIAKFTYETCLCARVSRFHYVHSVRNKNSSKLKCSLLLNSCYKDVTKREREREMIRRTLFWCEVSSVTAAVGCL